jgi:hypothetical protein
MASPDSRVDRGVPATPRPLVHIAEPPFERCLCGTPVTILHPDDSPPGVELRRVSRPDRGRAELNGCPKRRSDCGRSPSSLGEGWILRFVPFNPSNHQV